MSESIFQQVGSDKINIFKFSVLIEKKILVLYFDRCNKILQLFTFYLQVILRTPFIMGYMLYLVLISIKDWKMYRYLHYLKLGLCV